MFQAGRSVTPIYALHTACRALKRDGKSGRLYIRYYFSHLTLGVMIVHRPRYKMGAGGASHEDEKEGAGTWADPMAWWWSTFILEVCPNHVDKECHQTGLYVDHLTTKNTGRVPWRDDGPMFTPEVCRGHVDKEFHQTSPSQGINLVVGSLEDYI